MSDHATERNLRQDPSYKYVKHLVDVMETAGIEGEPMQLPIKAIMESPIPEYMPVVAAVQVKFMFILSLYQTSGRWGALQDGMPGVHNMIAWALEER